MPGIFGMNFQSVSTAQKLPTSDGRAGGYDARVRTPGPVVRSSLSFVDHQVAALVSALARTHHLRDTTIILSAKHGQSPKDNRSLTRIDDGAVLDVMNAAWKDQHPAAPQPLVAASLNDDGMLLWFTNGDRTRTADRFATRFLQGYDGTGTGTDGRAMSTDVTGAPAPYTSAGLAKEYAGHAVATFLGARRVGPRTPDLVGIARHGVVYTSKTAKIAEHGGDAGQDRHVPLVVAGPGIRHAVKTVHVQTTRIAPTILALLGLNPRDLAAVRIEHTPQLPLG